MVGFSTAPGAPSAYGSRSCAARLRRLAATNVHLAAVTVRRKEPRLAPAVLTVCQRHGRLAVERLVEGIADRNQTTGSVDRAHLLTHIVLVERAEQRVIGHQALQLVVGLVVEIDRAGGLRQTADQLVDPGRTPLWVSVAGDQLGVRDKVWVCACAGWCYTE